MATSTGQNSESSVRLAPVFRALETIATLASAPNWDGYEAQALQPGAVDEARRVLGVLPPEVPPPQPCVEPDGSLGLEWHARAGWTYVLTVSGRGHIEYAGLFGENETHGRERFRGSLPPLVSEHLRRVASPE